MTQEQPPQEGTPPEGMPPTQPTPPPTGAQQQSPAQPPPPVPPMPGGGGGGRSRTGLFVGGCAVAAILGLIVLVVVGALLFFLLAGGGGEQGGGGGVTTTSPPPSSSEPTEASPPPSSPEPTEGSSPSGGSLADLVEEQAGPFTLDPQSIEELPDFISAGATDALGMGYVHEDGTELGHLLTAWASPEDANAAYQEIRDGLVSEEGYQLVGEEPVQDQEGNQVGTVAQLKGEDEIVIWTNGSLLSWAEAPEGYPVEFYNNVPY